MELTGSANINSELHLIIFGDRDERIPVTGSLTHSDHFFLSLLHIIYMIENSYVHFSKLKLRKSL